VISGLVLAAGESRRFGRTKQLVEHRGKTLLQHSVDALADAGVDEIVVVTGHDADAVEASVRLPANARVVRNPAYREGQASSLGAGLHALDGDSEAAVVLMTDQPDVTADVVRALVRRFLAARSQIVRAAYRDGPGPSLLSREIYAEAGHLFGDEGARGLMASHPDWVDEVPIDRPAPPDVDTPADLESIRPTTHPGDATRDH
jgi:molybdenum cofactor cytidylyltransferase